MKTNKGENMKKILNLMAAVCCVLSCAFIIAGCDIVHKEHQTSDEWIMNNSHHWHECDGCNEKVDLGEHDWEETVLIEATPTEDGVMHYECKGCGMDRVEEYSITTVTEEVWNTALNLNSFDNIKLIAQTEDQTLVFIKDEDVLCFNSNPVRETDGYYSIESGKYYHYKQNSGFWAKTEINQDTYNEIMDGSNIGKYLSEISEGYSDFVYNKELHAYEYEDEREWEEGKTYTKTFTLYFESGKLVKMVFENNNGQGETSTCTLEYNNNQLELPNTTLVTEEVWNTALNLVAINNYNVHAISEMPDGTIVVDGIVTKDGDIVRHKSMSDNNGYYSKEGAKYYYYKEVSDTWTKTEITQEEYEGAAGKSFSSYNYSAFTYNEELKAYEATVEEVFVQVYFENGRLVKLVGTHKSEDVQTVIVEYVEVELELPNAVLVTVTEAEWNTALDLLNVNDYKMYAKSELPDGTIVVDGTITKDGDIVCHKSIPDNNGYYSKEGAKYYYYKEVSGTWTKTEITQERYESAAGKSFSSYNYSAFTYNEESQAYEASVEEVFVQVYFENGRLVKLVGTHKSEDVQTIMVEYIETELVLPTVD